MAHLGAYGEQGAARERPVSPPQFTEGEASALKEQLEYWANTRRSSFFRIEYSFLRRMHPLINRVLDDPALDSAIRTILELTPPDPDGSTRETARRVALLLGLDWE